MKTTRPEMASAKPESAPAGVPAGTESGAPVQKVRHGLYFFLLFVLPMIALFIVAFIRGHE
jgi:hypothetical protein